MNAYKKEWKKVIRMMDIVEELEEQSDDPVARKVLSLMWDSLAQEAHKLAVLTVEELDPQLEAASQQLDEVKTTLEAALKEVGKVKNLIENGTKIIKLVSRAVKAFTQFG